ncbi:hypothetical protein ACRALDRAFT_1083047 [Sodiomyces alcalophilus JCM 7366]|uniref:uncharacterized protein n=1 Tax=Sodiomyces alcalophilus JCM 7366 TaxID=591952 RepID=UPI0039B55155
MMASPPYHGASMDLLEAFGGSDQPSASQTPNGNNYLSRLEQFRRNDLERDAMIQELIRRYEDLKKAYSDKCADYNNEVESRHGDGAVFNDNLIAKGAEGGAEAAYLLQSEIKSYIKNAYPQTNTGDWNIIVQVILNLDGLAKKLHSCGIAPKTPENPTLAAFARAFGRSQPLFSFVDVGSGKESADHKIREMLRLMVRVAQCKHIFFGPCSDNGYLPVLEPYKRDVTVFHRLTLLETLPAQPGFRDLGLETASFPSVFRSEPLPTKPLTNTLPPAPSSLVNGSPRKAALAPASAPASAPAPAPTPKPSQVRAPSETSVLSSSLSDDQPVVPTPASSSAAATSWSTITRTIPSANPKAIDISVTKKAPRKYYLINADSQRVDEPLPRIDPAAERKFKDMMAKNGTNFCNNHYLLGGCESAHCTYYHGEKLALPVLNVLKQKVRGIPCELKTQCEDPTCIYAHHCRWARNCPQSSCRFAYSHDMDLVPRLKIFDDNTVQHLSPK